MNTDKINEIGCGGSWAGWGTAIADLHNEIYMHQFKLKNADSMIEQINQ